MHTLILALFVAWGAALAAAVLWVLYVMSPRIRDERELLDHTIARPLADELRASGTVTPIAWAPSARAGNRRDGAA